MMAVVQTVQTQKQISPFRLLVTSGFGILFDSMDVGILAFVLAVLKKLWHLSPQQVGLLGSINLVGMAIGAAMAGMLADKFGRKNVFLWTLLVYSLATGASALAAGFASLLVFRFLALHQTYYPFLLARKFIYRILRSLRKAVKFYNLLLH